MELKIEKMTEGNSAVYGILVKAESSEPVYKGADFSFFKNLGIVPFSGRAGVSLVEAYQDRTARVNWLEKHECSKEVIIPTDRSIILLLGVGPDGTDPDRVQALELEAGDAFIVHEDVWHCAPLSSSGTTKVLILLNQDTPDSDLIKVDTEEYTFV